MRKYDRSVLADLLQQAREQIVDEVEPAMSPLWAEQFAEWVDRRFAELWEEMERIRRKIDD